MKTIVKASMVVAICAISTISFGQTEPKKADNSNPTIKKMEMKEKPKAKVAQKKINKKRSQTNKKNASPAKLN